MMKIKNIARNAYICFVLICLMLVANLLWYSSAKVFAETRVIYGNVTTPTGLNNALRDDDGGATVYVDSTRTSLSVQGFSSSNLGTIDSIQVFYKIPSATIDITRGSTTWNLKMIYGPNTTTDVDLVKTGTNVAPAANETKVYSNKPGGQPWQWSDLVNLRLTMETTYEKGNKSIYNVDAFYILVNYTTTPVGDITPPTFSLTYYEDEALSKQLPIKDGSPVAGAKTIYIKAIPSEPLLENPTIRIEAPGAQNDVSSSIMTSSGEYYFFPWNVNAGIGDGMALVAVTGKDKASIPNTGTSQENILVDTTITKPQLSASAGSQKVELNWTTIDTDVQGYALYRSTSSNFSIGLDKLVQEFSASTTRFTDTSVVVGQSYFYKLVAKDIAGNNSIPSNEVSATPFQDITGPNFTVEFYRNSELTEDSKVEIWQDIPITKIQTLYLKIEANEPLKENPTVSIQAPGILNDITQITEAVSGNMYKFSWSLQSGEQDGLADIFITGEDLNGNKTINIRPVIGGQLKIDSSVSITQWNTGYPISGMGIVDLAWTNQDNDIKSFKIYRDIYADFTIDQINNSNLLLVLTNKKYRDNTATAPNTYYYRILATDYAGNTSLSEEAFGIPEKVNPHGNYTGDTNMCAQCHKAHGGKQSYNLKEKVKDVCYVCHDAGGQSINYVKGEMTLTGSHHPVDLASSTKPVDFLNCSDCHNPHLDWETVPRLLTTRNNSLSGNAVCFTCHGNSNESLNKQSNFPELGVGHNNINFMAKNGLKPFKGEYSNPSTGTNIGCVGCHEEHGSSLTKLLRIVDWNTDSLVPDQNDKKFCYECHNDPLNTSRDNAWDGSSIYDIHGQPKHNGSGSQCTTCHDPHGSSNGNYLKASYDTSDRGTGRTKAYNPNDFNTCTKCHTKITDITDPAANTGFANIRQDWPAEKQNLHYYHLNQLAAKGLGNAVCKECHRPHGTLAEENQARTALVGFPSNSVSALSGNATPIFGDSGETGGNCTLVCHGVIHKKGTPQAGEIDSTYLGSASPGGGLSTGGQDCAICHNNNVGAAKLTDRMKAATGGFKHLIDSTDTYSYVYNPNATNCLNTCHVDHDLFNNNMGANLRTSVTDTSPTAGVNTDFISTRTDGGICTSCHKDVVNKRYDTSIRGLFTKAVDPAKYKQSAHDYEVSTSFSYDDTTFKANCVKCHNDNMGKDSTGSEVMIGPKFAMHESSFRDSLSSFSILSPPNPLGQKHCYGCHGATGEFYSTPNQVAGDVENDFKKPYRHKIESTTSWNWQDCKDCHDTHYSKKGNRLSGAGGSNVDFTKVAPSLVGATGVYVTTWQSSSTPAPNTETLWSPASSSGYTSVVIKDTDPANASAYVCLKCHSSYVSSLPLAINGELTKDKAKDFNPNNLSLHPIFGPGKNVVLASNANRQSLLKAPWNNTTQVNARMTCTDCHNADSSGNGPFGTHGSDNPFMLRAYGAVGQTGAARDKRAYDQLCLLCHVNGYNGGNAGVRWAHGSNSLHFYGGGNVLGCLTCHAGPAGYVTNWKYTATSNGGRRGSIHGSNFMWNSPNGSSPARSMLTGGHLTGLFYSNTTRGSTCYANPDLCGSNHAKAW